MHARGDAADFADRAAEERLVDVGIEVGESAVLRSRRWLPRWLTSATLAASWSGPGRATRAAASATATKAARGTIELERLPWTQARAQLLGELRGIGRGAKRLGRENRRRLMVLTAAGSVRAHRHDDVGPQGPDMTHEVAENLLPSPLLERFLLAERIAKVHRAREVLLGAIEAVCRQEFLGAENAQRVEELRADLVLSAVAARGGDERHPRPDVPRVERERRVVLVVWMRGHVRDRPDRRQLPQRQRQGRCPRQVGERLNAILGNGLLGAGGPLQRDRRGNRRGQESRHSHWISKGREVRNCDGIVPVRSDLVN